MAQLGPNINWLREASGSTVEIELNGETYQITVEAKDE